jgi:hypothetical protein
VRTTSQLKTLVIEGQECALHQDGLSYRIAIHHPNGTLTTLARNCQKQETAIRIAGVALRAQKARLEQ